MTVSPEEDYYEDKMIAMVIRWEYYDVRTGETEPHAVFVEEYDAANQTFLCVNSWGPDQRYPGFRRQMSPSYTSSP